MASSTPRAYEQRIKAAGKDAEGAEKLTATKAKELSDADLKLAREQFKGIYDATRDLRARWKADHEYADGVYPDGTTKRWTPTDKAAMGDRPMMHIDAIGPIMAQVINGLAESRPAADMEPIGGSASDEKAEAWEGVIRRVQTSPKAEYAGAYAIEHLTKLGFGGWALTAKYPEYTGDPNDPANWEMELERVWIDNQHSIWLGPAQEPDGSDRMFGFILRPLTKEQCELELGEGSYEANKSAFADIAGEMGAAASCWAAEGRSITVASWYRVKVTKITINGTGADGQPVSREVPQRRVCLSTITATNEYAYSELPIPYIPVVYGEVRRSNVDGEVDVKGMVRALRHPQDLLNTWPGYISETIAKAARQEVIAAEGQITTQNQGFWDMTKRLAYRLYKPFAVDGTMVAAPQIHTYEAPIQAMTAALQQAESFVRKAAGAYDADSDQTRSTLSKESGIARQVRQQQSELGNSDIARAYAFMNLFEVKLIMAWAKHVYTAARILRIAGRDEKPKVVVTHFGEDFAQDAAQMAQGVPVKPGAQPAQPFDLGDGRYDMKARVIKNPLTQRQENVDLITNVMPALPPEMQVKVFPIMLDEMEGTIAKRVAAALKPAEEQTVSVEDAQKAQQVIDELTAKVEELQREKDAKSQDNMAGLAQTQMQTESQERIQAAKLAVDVELAKLDGELKLALAEFEVRKLSMQAEIDAREAELSHERGIEAGEHAAAVDYALQPEEPEPSAEGVEA